MGRLSNSNSGLLPMDDSDAPSKKPKTLNTAGSLQSVLENLAKSGALKAAVEASKSMKTFTLPPSLRVPELTPLVVPPPQERNHYQSAGALMRRLADTILEWRDAVPGDAQPQIVAILHGGIQVDVTLLAEEGFHGIRIEGTIDGQPCMLLAHQSSVQLLCHVVKVEEPEQRRTIGFVIDGEKHQV